MPTEPSPIVPTWLIQRINEPEEQGVPFTRHDYILLLLVTLVIPLVALWLGAVM